VGIQFWKRCINIGLKRFINELRKHGNEIRLKSLSGVMKKKFSCILYITLWIHSLFFEGRLERYTLCLMHYIPINFRVENINKTRARPVIYLSGGRRWKKFGDIFRGFSRTSNTYTVFTREGRCGVLFLGAYADVRIYGKEFQLNAIYPVTACIYGDGYEVNFFRARIIEKFKYIYIYIYCLSLVRITRAQLYIIRSDSPARCRLNTHRKRERERERDRNHPQQLTETFLRVIRAPAKKESCAPKEFAISRSGAVYTYNISLGEFNEEK